MPTQINSLNLPAATIRQLAREELARRGVLSNRRDCEQLPRIIGQDGVTTYPVHAGQLATWNSVKQWVAVFAGNQSGKTVLAPYWLMREMQRCGPGDYGVIAPNYPMLDNKAKPELLRVFRGMVTSSGNELIVTPEGCEMLGWPKGSEGRILLRHAMKPEAIEAFTLKGLWIEEPGQIEDSVWEAIQPRLAVSQGRILFTGRPMMFNWYISQIWDKRTTDDRIEVVHYRSIDNPAFSPQEYERQKASLPPWRFAMRYDGIPTRPAGLVYDCIDDSTYVDSLGVDKIPLQWRFYIGLDFGLINTAAVILVEPTKRDILGDWTDEPRGEYIVVGSYHAGEQRTAREHMAQIRGIIDQLVEGGRSLRPTAVGGSHQESGWRESWGISGLGVAEPPINKVESQIAAAYTGFKTGKLKIWRPMCGKLIDELENFSYELDDDGEPTDKLLDEVKYHRLAGLRYLASRLFRSGGHATAKMRMGVSA